MSHAQQFVEAHGSQPADSDQYDGFISNLMRQFGEVKSDEAEDCTSYTFPDGSRATVIPDGDSIKAVVDNPEASSQTPTSPSSDDDPDDEDEDYDDEEDEG